MTANGGGSTAAKLDELRVKNGLWAIAMGLGTVLLVFVASIFRFSTAADVAAVVGAVTGVVGTVVGAFFGLQIGSSGKEKAEAERKVAEDKATALAGALPPQEADRILASFR